MKLFKLAAITSALTLALTGCSGVPGLIPEEPVSMIGLTGVDLTSVAKFDDMNVDDKLMFWSCRQLHAYQTDESIDDSGEVSTLNPGEGKSFMRGMGLDQLNMLVGDYPEVQIYIDGVTQELADEESSDPGFDSFVKVCKTYSQVQESIAANYAPPVTVNAGCYNTPDVKATLQEELDGSWDTSGIVPKLKKIDYCDSDYPYGANFVVSRSVLDSDRSFRVVYKSTDGNFSNGKSSMTSDVVILTTTDESLSLGSGW
jgi:hypothetical protein